MRENKSHRRWARFSKLMAVTLALVLSVGVLPAQAGTKEIMVRNKKQLVEAMESDSSATIIFRTNRSNRFIIPAGLNSENKELVMDAPGARAFNKASFKAITLKKAEYFNERGDGNSLYIKGDDVKLTISRGIETKKVSITATNALVKVANSGNVGDIVCNKKDAQIRISVAENAKANIIVKKKTELTVGGDKDAGIKVVSQASGSKITVTAPVDLVAVKNVDVILEKGAEGSTVDSAKDALVELSGEAEKQATVKEDGNVIREAEPQKEDKLKNEETDKEASKDQEKTPATETPATETPATEPDPGSNPAVTPDKGMYKITYRVENPETGTVVVTDSGYPHKVVESGSKVASGTALFIELKPSKGYSFEGITVSQENNCTRSEYSGNTWLLDDLKGDLEIVVKFKRDVIEQPQNVLRLSAVETTTVWVKNGGYIFESNDNGATESQAKKFSLKETKDNSDREIATVWVVTGSAITRIDDGNDVTAELQRSFDCIDFSGVGDLNHDIITRDHILKLCDKFINVKWIWVPSNYDDSLLSGLGKTVVKNTAPKG
ncbi:MAG: hypothetical protein IK138_09740 [Lachnospiraceae bacterium]|nr:hypothetical protein [Lachnospiraceae bacterium]